MKKLSITFDVDPVTFSYQIGQALLDAGLGEVIDRAVLDDAARALLAKLTWQVEAASVARKRADLPWKEYNAEEQALWIDDTIELLRAARLTVKVVE